jgi:hypothetical protein
MRGAAVGALAFAFALGVTVAGAASRELTGYGATRAAWNAHHKEAKLTILRPGCCFGPQQNDGQFRYYNVQLSPRARIFMYDMDFGPRIDASDARKRVKSELPPDARLASHKRKKHCEQFDYKSARAKRALGRARVGVEFAADATASDSYKGKVKKVAIGSLVSTTQDCGLF